MTGKGSNDVTTTNRSSASELASNNPVFLIVKGLRLDFLRTWNSAQPVSTSPKLFNTTADPITYNISSLSTNDSYSSGINTTIAFNAYSFNIDGDDHFTTTPGAGEYVNAMLTFPNGEWYNCTWHANQDGVNYYFYTTAQRLN